MEILSAINTILRKPFGTTRHAEDLKRRLIDFTELLDDVSDSSSRLSREADDLKPLLACLEDNLPAELDVFCTKTLKILLRKTPNRLSLGGPGVRTIVIVLRRHVANRSIVPVDVCHVVLNACYDSANAQAFVEENGLEPLLVLLNYRDSKVLGGALSALQTICFVPSGRQAMRLQPSSLVRVSECLTSLEDVVRARAVGVIHNLSVDIASILPLREASCIHALVGLLRDHSWDTCTAATGTLQNIAREPLSKSMILELGAVELLADLLCCDSVPCQVAAVGAILNLIGDTLSAGNRELLKEVMVDGIVLGAIRSSVFSVGDGEDVGEEEMGGGGRGGGTGGGAS